MQDSTRTYYEAQAENYFRTTCSQSLWPLWNKLSKRLEPNAVVLDLGCGSGRDVRHFTSQGFRVIGLDLSFNLLRLAKRFSHLSFVQADFQLLPFRNNSFDAVWAIGSLLHAPRQLLPSVLAKIRRALKPKGVFLASVKKGHGETVDVTGRHFVFYQPDEWKSILTESRYEEIEIEEMSEPRKTESGDEQEIIWIVSIATSTTKKLYNT